MRPQISSRLSLFLYVLGAVLAALSIPAFVLFRAEGGWRVLAAGLVLGGAAAAFLAWHLGREAEDLARMAREIGLGNYDRRLSTQPDQVFWPLARALNEMAEHAGERSRSVVRGQAMAVAVLESMREGVMICGRSGRIVAVNRALREMFPGLPGYEGVRPIEVVPSPELQAACEAVLGAVGAGAGTAVPASLTVEGRDGLFLEVGLARLGEPEPGVAAVFHDLTQYRRLQSVGRDLVANVTHELRTPLTSIKGYAETLLDEPGGLPPQAARFVEVIRRNADHMTLMTDDLLSLSRIENDREPPATVPVPLAKAVDEAWRECSQLAKDKGIELEAGPLDGVVLSADPGQLVQVLRNLLENAIRHAPEGSPVGVAAAVSGAVAEVSVSDMGPGVPPADRRRVFERFYRVERHRAKTGGGTGLGLAIAKHIVERHGGGIRVEPAAGEFTGAAFVFTWPVATGRGEGSDSHSE